MCDKEDIELLDIIPLFIHIQLTLKYGIGSTAFQFENGSYYLKQKLSLQTKNTLDRKRIVCDIKAECGIIRVIRRTQLIEVWMKYVLYLEE